jgi:hypothetical protein
MARHPAVVLGIVLNALIAVAFGALRLLMEAPPLRTFAWPGAVALVVAYAAPAALAAVAQHDRRPAALLGAGLLGLPLAFTALSGISLVLLVPTVCYLIGYTVWRSRPPLRAAGLAGIVAIAAAGIAALVLPFTSPISPPKAFCYTWTEDRAGHRSYSPARPDLSGNAEEHAGSAARTVGPGEAPGGQGCTSEEVTPAGAALGLGAVALALAVSLRLPQAAVTTSRPSG